MDKEGFKVANPYKLYPNCLEREAAFNRGGYEGFEEARKMFVKASIAKAILGIKKAVEEEYIEAIEDARMSGYESGKNEASKAERGRIIAWGLEPCPHWDDVTIKVMKRDCALCWQALKGGN